MKTVIYWQTGLREEFATRHKMIESLSGSPYYAVEMPTGDIEIYEDGKGAEFGTDGGVGIVIEE